MSAVVEVRGLRKAFGREAAVRDVSFVVGAGEVFGILGPNGAGKTTTVECLSGAVAVDAGTVRVLGVDPARDRALIRERVGYQLQSAVLPPSLRVGEALRLFSAFYADPVPVPALLRAVDLTAQRTQRFGALSGGQRQRLSVALALVGRPDVVILDELTTGVDPQGRREVWRLVERLRDDGTTVLLVSHDLDEVDRLCDRLAVIAAGRTRFVGTPDDLRRRARRGGSAPRTLEDAYVALLDEPDTRDGAAA